jgi:hypothetical protein
VFTGGYQPGASDEETMNTQKNEGLNREVGELATEIKFLTKELIEIRRDIRTLLVFRWKLAGITSLAALTGGVSIEGMLHLFLKQHGG